MYLARDLQILGLKLQSLIERGPDDKAGLDEWYKDAMDVWRFIQRNEGLSNEMPAIVWHFLSDADIRLKDEEYRREQIGEISEIVRKLKHGQLPCD